MTVPPDRWARNVTAADAATSSKRGIFSTTRRRREVDGGRWTVDGGRWTVFAPCRSLAVPARSTCSTVHSSQRPVIQQQEKQRPGHQHRFGHQPQGQGGGHRQVAKHARAAGVPGVGPNRQQAEQPAEHVLPLGDPGHRFDVQRMHREDGRHQGAPPHAGRHCPQHQEQHQRHWPRAARR